MMAEIQMEDSLEIYRSSLQSFICLESRLRNNNGSNFDILTILMGLQKDLPTLILDFADKDNVKDDVWCYKAMVKELGSDVSKGIKKVKALIRNEKLLQLLSRRTGQIPRAPNRSTSANVHSFRSNVKENENKAKEDVQTTELEKCRVNPELKGFCDVAGMESIKSILKSTLILPFYQPQLFENIEKVNRILFYGPPGTGKTRLVKALTAEAGVNLCEVTASEIMSPLVGEIEKKLQSIFHHIQNVNMPTILFIDEIDGIFRKRVSDEAEYSRRMKTEFMRHLSNFATCSKALLICATNCPWDMDTAFIRRFQKRIYIPLPDACERNHLLHFFTKNFSLNEDSTQWESLIYRTEGYSGSDLQDLVTYALTTPIMELENEEIWKIDGDTYRPRNLSDDFSNLAFKRLEELPPGTARARPVEFRDLYGALNYVGKTVSKEEVEKYQNYASKT